MRPKVEGLHHITVICGEPDVNADFYIDVLGLRLVKKTVNHDAPELYHLIYGDREGSTGSSITFFPLMAENSGEPGTGQVTEIGLRIPPQSVQYWKDRLHEKDVPYEVENLRGSETVIFQDPDGLGLRLIPEKNDRFEAWEDSDVPEHHQIMGMKQVKIEASEYDLSRQLIELMGLENTDSDFFEAEDGSGVQLIDSNRRGKMGRGSVHHIAFSVSDSEMLEAWREELDSFGLRPSKIIERKYFNSIYFRDPSDVLFEFATSGPGYTLDEDVDELGEKLVLPEKLKYRRNEIEKALTDFNR